MSRWIIIEINLIRILSLILFEKKKNPEIPIIYFLIQSYNSYIFLFRTLMINLINFNNWIPLILLINLTILTKIGIPPFYSWYLKIINNLNWINFFYISTIQKLIPLIILNNLINLNNNYILKFNLINIILFSIIISLIGIQRINLKLIITYSSIIQISWIIILIFINEIIMINFFIIYSLISLNLIKIFKNFNLLYINNFLHIKFNNNWIYLIYIISILSLARIPPFTGFLIKWLSIQNFNTNYTFLIILIIIFNSLIRIYFYIRIIIIRSINYNKSIKINYLIINFNKKLNYSTIILNWFNLIFLILYEIF